MQINQIIEALLLASHEPLSPTKIIELLPEQTLKSSQVEQILCEIAASYSTNVLELVQVASGYRFQLRTHFAPWVMRLFTEKPPKYSPALLETLAIIAYRQPVTRGDIEEIRGVSVSSTIFKTLLEREWIRVVGQRDVPGKPVIYATTKIFLDYFNLAHLSDLPELINHEQ